MAKHDIIVVGASAGGISALRRITADLPANLPAAVFVVLHSTEESPGALPELVNTVSKVPALYAVHNAPILPGRIYLAPRGRHLVLERSKIQLSGGPKENRHRPAVDVLFRSAAQAYGARVVGVVLSGYLDDGTAGLAEIKARGGITMVQDPETATADSMPRSAMENVEIDHVLSPEEIGGALVQLANGKAAPPAAVVPLKPPDEQVFTPTCPDCSGPMQEVRRGDALHYECIVGHAFSPETLLEARSDETERALWAAIRSFEEHAELSRKLGRRSAERKQDRLAHRFLERASASRKHADILRKLLDQASEVREATEDTVTGTEG